jgi:ABC-2 type transport system permease protein
MNKILRIARLEISILFYSPVAWLVLVIFMVQSGIGFFGMLSGYKEMFLMGEKISNLTFSLFPGMNGLFDKVLQTLYLYIPLLTMGLMSRETSSGSIKLLLSSPVRIREIVLGKYLAMVFYGLLLLLILVIFSALGITIIQHADVKLICSGLLALFLLTCTYAAIGLFMSCLTHYQVVAAISTLAVFALLRYVGNLGQDITFVRDLTYFLSISGRTEDMLKGLITSRDLIYYLLIIVLFLGLAILLLQSKRASKHWTVFLLKYTVFISCILLAGYLSSRPAWTGFIDMTAQKTRTLTRESQEVAQQIKGPLKITTYVNLLDQHVYTGLPVARNVDLSRFEEYRRFIPQLDMEYVYYYDAANMAGNRNMIYQGDITGLSLQQVAEKVADNFELDLNQFLTPAQIRQQIDLRSEDNAFVRVLSYNGRSSLLRVYNDTKQFPEETEMTAAIKRLVVPAPVIVFISGDNERSSTITGDRSYQLLSNNRKFRKALLNQGFEVMTIDLNRQELPREVSVLVLGDPGKPVGDTAFARIQSYLARGGNMLITGEPEHRQFINPVLQLLGVRLSTGMLVNGNKGNAPDLVQADWYTGSHAPASSFSIIRQYKGFVNMPGAAALEADSTRSYRVDTLLTSQATGWNKKQGFDLSANEVRFEPANGDTKGSFPTVLALQRSTGPQQQKIIICGDGDFMSNIALEQARGYNLSFIYGIFSWFTNGDFPVRLLRPAPADDALLADKKQLGRYRLLILWGIPALILAGGAILLISRKRK